MFEIRVYETEGCYRYHVGEANKTFNVMLSKDDEFNQSNNNIPLFKHSNRRAGILRKKLSGHKMGGN